jgi:nucleoside-diphosphate-sugar epimerase
VILVTGGSGFVGGHVAHELRGRDLPVRCLVRDARKAPQLTAWGCELQPPSAALCRVLTPSCISWRSGRARRSSSGA